MALFLGLIRIAAALGFLPLWQSTKSAVFPWLALSCVTALAIWPNAPLSAEQCDTIPFVAIALKELFVGVTIGVLLRMAFSILEMAADMTRISAMLTSETPETSPISQLFVLVGITVFFLTKGHHDLIFGLKHTFEVLPINQIHPPLTASFFSVAPAVKMLSSAVAAALFTAVPIFFAGYVADWLLLTLSQLMAVNMLNTGLLRRLLVPFVAVLTLGVVVHHTLALVKTALDPLF